MAQWGVSSHLTFLFQTLLHFQQSFEICGSPFWVGRSHHRFGTASRKWAPTPSTTHPSLVWQYHCQSLVQENFGYQESPGMLSCSNSGTFAYVFQHWHWDQPHHWAGECCCWLSFPCSCQPLTVFFPPFPIKTCRFGFHGCSFPLLCTKQWGAACAHLLSTVSAIHQIPSMCMLLGHMTAKSSTSTLTFSDNKVQGLLCNHLRRHFLFLPCMSCFWGWDIHFFAKQLNQKPLNITSLLLQPRSKIISKSIIPMIISTPIHLFLGSIPFALELMGLLGLCKKSLIVSRKSTNGKIWKTTESH